MEIVTNLKFDEVPKYSQLAALFADLVGTNAAYSPFSAFQHIVYCNIMLCARYVERDSLTAGSLSSQESRPPHPLM